MIIGPNQPTQKQTALIYVDDIHEAQREMMKTFLAKVNHLQPFLQKAMIKAYSDALDHMAMALDKARVTT